MSIQNEILNAIASRRSCRAYKPEQVTPEELEAVTTAGTWAATAMGRQSPVMVAVQDKETLAELSRLNAAVMGTQNDPFYGAPTAVLVLGVKNWLSSQSTQAILPWAASLALTSSTTSISGVTS